eukprot:m.139164 g.139164  ORF g.139164 m.139164 type:complete len:809 (-) comp16650_c2_seq1:43-2469(-)
MLGFGGGRQSLSQQLLGRVATVGHKHRRHLPQQRVAVALLLQLLLKGAAELLGRALRRSHPVGAVILRGLDEKVVRSPLQREHKAAAVLAHEEGAALRRGGQFVEALQLVDQRTHRQILKGALHRHDKAAESIGRLARALRQNDHHRVDDLHSLLEREVDEDAAEDSDALAHGREPGEEAGRRRVVRMQQREDGVKARLALLKDAVPGLSRLRGRGCLVQTLGPQRYLVQLLNEDQRLAAELDLLLCSGLLRFCRVGRRRAGADSSPDQLARRAQVEARDVAKRLLIKVHIRAVVAGRRVEGMRLGARQRVGHNDRHHRPALGRSKHLHLAHPTLRVCLEVKVVEVRVLGLQLLQLDLDEPLLLRVGHQVVVLARAGLLAAGAEGAEPLLHTLHLCGDGLLLPEERLVLPSHVLVLAAQGLELSGDGRARPVLAHQRLLLLLQQPHLHGGAAEVRRHRAAAAAKLAGIAAQEERLLVNREVAAGLQPVVRGLQLLLGDALDLRRVAHDGLVGSANLLRNSVQPPLHLLALVAHLAELLEVLVQHLQAAADVEENLVDKALVALQLLHGGKVLPDVRHRPCRLLLLLLLRALIALAEEAVSVSSKENQPLRPIPFHQIQSKFSRISHPSSPALRALLAASLLEGRALGAVLAEQHHDLLRHAVAAVVLDHLLANLNVAGSHRALGREVVDAVRPGDVRRLGVVGELVAVGGHQPQVAVVRVAHVAEAVPAEVVALLVRGVGVLQGLAELVHRHELVGLRRVDPDNRALGDALSGKDTLAVDGRGADLVRNSDAHGGEFLGSFCGRKKTS